MLKIEDLSFGYQRGVPLFNRLNWQLSGGNICGLLGKNGAGKTTLLKLLSGLRFPHSGTCRVLGFEPKARYPQFLEEVYFIPEQFFVPELTVKEYQHLYAPFYDGFNAEEFQQYLKSFELDLNKKIAAFSYGQQKKFLIAFGLATNCKLFILDEPTNGLDIPSKSIFRQLLASALSEEKTFIISTHQVRDMENLIDPIVILDDGKIIFNQSLEAITTKLMFSQSLTQPTEDVFYQEGGMGGFRLVTKNKTQEESKIDLELLFNAVVSNASAINKVFE